MKKLILSLLLALPLLANAAESVESFENVELEADRACGGCRHHNSNLRLSDFRGNYRSYGSSAGGVAGAATSGFSTTSISQFSLRGDGTGQINFISTAVYTGPIGTPLTVIHGTTPSINIPLIIAITSAEYGAGTISIVDYPFAGSNLLGDFVVKKDNGRVESFITNVIGYGGVTPNLSAGATLIFSERL